VQASCPQCQTRIQIDDAKVPDRPFNVKCPKCAAVVKLPGRAAAPAPAPASDLGAPAFSEESLRTVVATPLATPGERALVSFPDPGLAQAMGQTLTRLGYAVDVVSGDDAARLFDQGLFSVVGTARVAAPPGKGESLYQRVTRSSPEGRRRVFVILAGDEFKTGDGMQGWAVLADLVISTRDAPMADNAIRTVMAERNRLYQVYLDAKRRYDESFAAG
jgi:predicted Zn finger-like uncharacterized protein